MHIKIYFGGKPVFLGDQIDPEMEPYLHLDNTIFMEEGSAPAIRSLLHEIEQPDINAAIIQSTDLPTLQKNFFKKFTIIKAGGGAVWNEKNELLFMVRRGMWDLPKGKLDEGETIEACAIREVEEETGLHQPVITRTLLTTYHTYSDHGKPILKESHWFEMKVSGTQTLVPQTIEDISSLSWMPPNKWNLVKEKTFPSIIDVLTSLNP